MVCYTYRLVCLSTHLLTDCFERMKKDTPYNGLFLTGTDTGVGKTYIGSQLVALLHDKGINAVPRKPIESGCINNEGQLLPEDAHLYYEAAQTKF